MEITPCQAIIVFAIICVVLPVIIVLGAAFAAILQDVILDWYVKRKYRRQ